MAEELPENGADSDPMEDGEIGAPPARWRLSVTWMILLPLLVVAIGMLASDIFRGRLPQKAAFEKINGKLVAEPADDSEDAGGGFGGRGGNQQKPLTAEAVHELLGRQPDSSEKLSGNLNGKDASDVQMEPVVVETFKYPGIFKSYEVVVTYAETPASDTKPATTALRYVRKK